MTVSRLRAMVLGKFVYIFRLLYENVGEIETFFCLIQLVLEHM